MVKKIKDKKHVVVSGGGTGLGLKICEGLVASGYSISSFSRNMPSTFDTLPGAFLASVDIRNSDSLRDFVKNSVEVNGPIHGVINNSAIVQEGVLATLPEVEIENMVYTNLIGAIKLTRLCIREMLKTDGGGRIVNISSIIGTRGYNGLSVYSATKAGLDGFTRSLARELGRAKITVNSVAPGYMETSMSSSLNSGHLTQIMRRTPIGRLATPEDTYNLVSYLLSDEAECVTGQTILVDGGISC